MKFKLTYFLLAIIFFYSIISAQITITKSDFTSVYKIGNTYTSYSDTLMVSIDIGNTGGGNNWDFSGFTAHQSFQNSYLSPNGTPFASNFPTSDIVNYFSFTYSSGDTTTTSETWNYLSTTDASEIGSGTINSFSSGGNTDSITNITEHFPPFIMFDFPLEANKSWTSKDSTESTSISSQGTFTSTSTAVYNISVDAWGTMKLPDGNSYDALRLREESTTTTYFAGTPLYSSTSVDYIFISKTGQSFSISTENENPPTSGVINGFAGWTGGNITSVEKTDELPNEFSLQQNYPNPFNPSTTIKYSIPKESVVKLKIYNLLGKEVSTLVNSSQPAGVYKYNFDASKLSSGIYFISLQAGSFFQTKKMTLLK